MHALLKVHSWVGAIVENDIEKKERKMNINFIFQKMAKLEGREAVLQTSPFILNCCFPPGKSHFPINERLE